MSGRYDIYDGVGRKSVYPHPRRQRYRLCGTYHLYRLIDSGTGAWIDYRIPVKYLAIPGNTWEHLVNADAW